MSRKFLAAALFLLAAFPLLAQNCQVTYLSSSGISGGYSPMKAHIRGSYLYVHGGNFIKVFNIGGCDQPMAVGNTDNFIYTCGDGQQSTYDTAMFPGDSVIFLTTKCHGIIAYETASSPGSPARKGYAKANTVLAIASLKLNNARYLLNALGNKIFYTDFTDLGSSTTEKIPVQWDWWNSIGDTVSQMDCFYWNGKYYLAVNSLTDGFSLYDVTAFPNSATQVFSTNIESWGSRYYNGRIYVNGRDKNDGKPWGLRVYSVPNGQELGAFTGADFSEAINVWVDERFAYLGLGSCQYTGGFEIVDITDPANIYSVLPDGFTPHECGSAKDFDVVPCPGGGSGISYFFRSAFTVQETYKIENCGDFANVQLQSFSPTAVDPGGTYPITVTLRNTGNVDVSGVGATLSETHASVTVDAPASQTYGTLVGGGAAVSRTFNITVAGNAPAGPINFHLDIAGTGGGPWTADFVVNINAPHPNLVRSITKDVTSAILVTYTNTGNADYSGSFGVTLTPWTAGVTISPSTQTFTGTIAKGGSATKSYGYNTTGPGVCTPVDFISLRVANTDPTIGNDPADVNVDINGTAGRPMVLRTASSLSKTAGVYTLSLTLKNQGTATANGVAATLSASLGTLTWTTGMPVAYGDMAAGASVTRTAQFTVPDGTTGNVTFTAAVASVQGCWAYDFAHSLTDIQFAYKDEKHCAVGVNCGANLHPDIYEGSSTGPARINFWFKLQNTGTSNATDVPATLLDISNDSDVLITTNTATYTLASGAEGYNALPFIVELKDTYCSGDDSTCPPLKLRVGIPDYGFQADVQFAVKANTGGGGSSCILSYKTGSLQISTDTNSNGKAEPGEHVEFTIEIQNTGTADAPSVSATISEDANKSQYTSFTAPTQSFGTIAAAQTKRNTTTYKFDLTGDAVTGTYYFPVSITSSCAPSAFTGTIPMTVYTAGGDVTLTYQSYSVDDTSGDNDDSLDPGETVYLSVALKNESSTAINGATATLTASTSGVTIAGTSSFSAMAGKIGTAVFAVTLSGSYSGATVPFSIAVAGASVTNPSFTVSVGTSSAPALSYTGTTVDDLTGDDQWQAGETVDLYVTLQNTSESALNNALATLVFTGASGVTINSSNAFYTAAAGVSATVKFRATLDAAYAAATVPFRISVAGATVSNGDFTVPVGGGSGNALVIPVVAHAAGAQGTTWKTDLQIHNGSAASASYTLKLIKSNATNDTPPEVTFSISPGGNLIFRDVLNNASLPAFMGYTRGSLLLEYTGGVPPAVSSRVYNDQGALGTYGQFVPAITVDGRTRGTAGNIPSILFGLAKTDRYRSNVGLVNVTAFWNELRITLYDGSGNPAGGTLAYTLAPYNMIQLDDILATAGGGSTLPAFSARVESVSVKDFVAYASIVDNRTGDASFISDQIRSHAESMVPGVAHAAGSAGSNWRTDLSIHNPDTQPVTVQLNYYRYGYDGFAMGIRLNPIPARGTLLLEDVLTIFPGLAAAESGYLVAVPVNAVASQPLVSARTYNYYQDPVKGPSTYGQYIPAADYAGGAGGGGSLIMTGLSSNGAFRLNIGIINADIDGPALVNARLLNTYGGVLGSHDYYFAYFRMGLQINNDQLLADLGVSGPFEGATLVLTVGGDNVHAYASSVDNITNDPIYIEPLQQ
jgi:hypothetical protein